jgi:ribonuclease Z
VRLTVLGSGDAFSGCGCNAGYVLDGAVLVDCGAPVHVLVPRAGGSLRDLRLVLLTHFHADHTFMLPLLLGSRAFALEGAGPLTVAGPVGTREYVIRLINDGYGQRIGAMLEGERRLRFAVLQDGSDTPLEGFRVRAHAVVHSTGPSLAYAVSGADGVTVGFSGDTALCAPLERVIEESDLMVCECTRFDATVEGGHLWAGQVADLMERHPRTPFVLSHLSERRELPGAIVAHDLLTLQVARRPEPDPAPDPPVSG